MLISLFVCFMPPFVARFRFFMLMCVLFNLLSHLRDTIYSRFLFIVTLHASQIYALHLLRLSNFSVRYARNFLLFIDKISNVFVLPRNQVHFMHWVLIFFVSIFLRLVSPLNQAILTHCVLSSLALRQVTFEFMELLLSLNLLRPDYHSSLLFIPFIFEN